MLSSSNSQLEPLQRSQLPPYRQSPLHKSIKPGDSIDEDELDDLKPLPRTSIEGEGDVVLEGSYNPHRNDVGRFRSGSTGGVGIGSIINNTTIPTQRIRSASQTHPTLVDEFNTIRESREYGWSQDSIYI